MKNQLGIIVNAGENTVSRAPQARCLTAIPRVALRRGGILALSMAAVLLGGCATVEQVKDIMGGPKTDYKSAAKSLPPLEIPPDLTRPANTDRFSVPNSPAGASTTFSEYAANRTAGPRAGTSDILPEVGKIRMERAGSQRWLVIPEPPEKVWPVVKEFWQGSGFLVNVENPEAGVMETDWAENRAKLPQDWIRSSLGRLLDQLYSTGERDKFRTRLERSADGKSTEVYISHRGLEEVLRSSPGGGGVRDSQPVWQARPSDPDLEAEFLRRMMVRFGVDESRAKEQLAGAARIERAKLVKAPDGSGAIDVDEPFDRAWRRVGLALDRVGFTVEDRDRSKGYYFVRYVNPEIDAATGKKDEGLLGKLAFWRSSTPDAKPEQFRVLVKNAPNDATQISVLDKNGGNDKSESATRILGLLHTQLK